MSQVPCLHEHLANAARVKYPAALQRCKFDALLLAVGYLAFSQEELLRLVLAFRVFKGKRWVGSLKGITRF